MTGPFMTTGKEAAHFLVYFSLIGRGAKCAASFPIVSPHPVILSEAKNLPHYQPIFGNMSFRAIFPGSPG